MANPTGAATPLGIPNFAGTDRPRLASTPGLPDILASIDTLLQASGLSTLSGKRPVARLNLAAGATSIANNTWTAISFPGGATIDTDTMYAAGAPTRLTFKTAGVYAIGGGGAFVNAAGGARFASLYLNGGVRQIARDTKAADSLYYSYLKAFTVWQVNANDYVEMFVYQSSGAPINFLADTGVDQPDLFAVRLA